MRKWLILFFCLFTVTLYAQYATPSGWTSFVGLRMYGNDTDNPGKDSLNQNSLDIDTYIKANYDTINAIKADLYTAINYSGALKNGVVYSTNLNTELDTNLVKTTGADYIYQAKTFTASTFMKDLFPLANDTYYLGLSPLRWGRLFSKYVHTQEIFIVDPTNSDSAAVSYDGSELTFDKPVKVDTLRVTDYVSFTGDASLDSTTINGFRIREQNYTISTTKDSIITIGAGWSGIVFNSLPGNVDSIKTITTSVGNAGQIIILTNTDPSYTITLADQWGNIYLPNGNIVLDRYESVMLKYTYLGFSTWGWVKVGK